jgi:hypothetical protein
VYTSAYERFLAHVKKHSANVTSRKKGSSEKEQTTKAEDEMAEARDDMYSVEDIETGPVVRDETEETHDQDEDEDSEAGSMGTGTAAGKIGHYSRVCCSTRGAAPQSQN